jgi:hypothetical protein
VPEGDDILQSYFSYGVVVRSPLSEIEKLRTFINNMEETRIVCENVTCKNQWLTQSKPDNRILSSVIDTDSTDER